MDVPSKPERIDALVGDKFVVEDIDTEDPVYLKCIDDCNNAIPAIIEALSDGYYKNINKYIATI